MAMISAGQAAATRVIITSETPDAYCRTSPEHAPLMAQLIDHYRTQHRPERTIAELNFHDPNRDAYLKSISITLVTVAI